MEQLRGLLYKLVIIVAGCLFFVVSVSAQRKNRFDHEFGEFNELANRAGVVFTMPDGFKEIRPLNSDETSFVYGITIPGDEFEIWFDIRPFKASQIAGYRTSTNPDSVYVNWGKNQAAAFSADDNYLARNLPESTLTDYNADWGKSYFIALNDSPYTRHYRYALLITLQKNHTGTIIAVCLTNDRGADFFQNINKARNCIRFK